MVESVRWNDERGWSGNLLYIVEGYRASADNYKSVFERKSYNGYRTRLNRSFSTVGILLAYFDLGLCSGIITLSSSSNNYD